MLTITVNDDGTVTLTSDDKLAENVTVQDALEENEDDLALIWQDAPFVNGVMSVKFEADDAERLLIALEGATGLENAQGAIEAAFDALRPHQGGGPKPSAHAG